MIKYRILRTDTADSQLHKIVLGIAENFGIETALEKLNKIESRIMCLAENPEIGMLPKYMVLRRQGYRVLVLEKDLIFYKIHEEIQAIVIYAVFDQRQDYINILLGL